MFFNKLLTIALNFLNKTVIVYIHSQAEKVKIMPTESTCGQPELKEKKRLTVFGVEFVYLYLFGICLACFGWIAENVVKIITQGRFDCRFHLLPFISPYALIPFAFQILLGDPDNLTVFGRKLFKEDCRKNKILSNIVCAVLICAAVFLGELAIGSIWEAISGVQLWDYSGLPLQVNRYAGLLPAIGYGGGAYLIFKFIYKPLLGLMRRKVKFNVAKIICCTLGVLIVLDTLAMAIQIIVTGQAPMYWQVILW